MTYITLLNSNKNTQYIVDDIKIQCGDEAQIKENNCTTHVCIMRTSSMVINASGHCKLVICSTERSSEDFKIDIDLNDINTILEM